jgi:hypothetical protein
MPGRAIRVEELHVQRPVDRKHKMLLLPFSSCKAPGRKGGVRRESRPFRALCMVLIYSVDIRRRGWLATLMMK